jgi:hypothetical protein
LFAGSDAISVSACRGFMVDFVMVPRISRCVITLSITAVQIDGVKPGRRRSVLSKIWFASSTCGTQGSTAKWKTLWSFWGGR